MMLLANQRAAQADVRGIERVVTAIHRWDAAMGEKRPDAVNSLIEAVQAKLDAARRLQLARDRYALRLPELTRYRVAIRTPIDLFARLAPALESVKALSGSAPATLDAISAPWRRFSPLASAIAPPEELVAAHALLISAVQLAGNAAKIRREATLASDITRAWDASSAAAGALMLGRAPVRHPKSAEAAATQVITPRRTRLVRVPELQTFRRAIAKLTKRPGSTPGARGSV